ncbi:MAG: YDG domain-containing protein, partial [Verrucomicrobiales bacterium]
MRLAATAVPGGAYNAKTIALTSTDATTVNITTAASGNTVSTKALTLTGLTGVNKVYTGTTAATATGTAALSGVNGSDTVTPGGSPVYDFASASVGTTKSITTTGYTLGGAQASYYSLTQPSLTANITVAPLTITANPITKIQGATLSSPVSGSTAFSSSGLVNSETIGSVTITYGPGAASNAVADVYTGSVVASDATGGTFTPSNYEISYAPGDITVSASPAISAIGTLSAVSTTYGTASASPSSFSVSGGFLTGDLTVTAPSPFVISTSSGGTYTSSLVLAASAGTVASTTIYVRLPATATVSGSPYSGNVSISGGGATTQNVATASSTVAAKALTLSGLTGVGRAYDRTTTATLSGTPAYVGLANGESFSVSGTAAASFATKTVGTAKPITVIGYQAPSSNYSITQPTGLTADITSVALTVTGASVTSKSFDGAAAATITGASLVGVIALDTVTVSGGGTFADVNVANGIAVTTALTLGGADAANYTLDTVGTATANITS